MHDSPTLTWREVVAKYHSSLVDELSANLDSAFDAERIRGQAEIERIRRDSNAELERVRTELTAELERLRHQSAAERAQSLRETEASIHRNRQEIAELWNQAVRRFHHVESESAVFALLAELSTPHALHMVVVTGENGHVVARRGIDERDLIVSVPDAAAIRSVIETKDPMTAAITRAEISTLADALADPEGKVYLFPLVARQQVKAVLLASGNVSGASLELLSGIAALKLDSLSAPAPKTAPEKNAWEALSEDDQKLHLQAQRVARVKVAELRLYHSDELRKGVAERNIYGALHDQIETIRTSFLQTFLSKSPTMVDYLHLELVRSLAHDDERLLGESYPGPMV